MTLGPPLWATGSWAVDCWADGTWAETYEAIVWFVGLCTQRTLTGAGM